MIRSEVDRRIVESAPGVFSPVVYMRLLKQEPHFIKGDHMSPAGRKEIRKRLHIIQHHTLPQARLSGACRRDPRVPAEVRLRQGILTSLLQSTETVFVQ